MTDLLLWSDNWFSSLSNWTKLIQCHTARPMYSITSEEQHHVGETKICSYLEVVALEKLIWTVIQSLGNASFSCSNEGCSVEVTLFCCFSINQIQHQHLLPVCPFNLQTSLPVAALNTRTLWSSQPVIIIWKSGENATLFTWSVTKYYSKVPLLWSSYRPLT